LSTDLCNEQLTSLQDDYDKKARELKDQQAEIAIRIEQHQRGDAEYRTTLESLISASWTAELFERSKTDQKRQLIALVFSNLQLRGKKLEFSLRSPFDLMVDRRSYTSWLAFLNTVRTQHFEQVLALRPSLLAIATAAHGGGRAFGCEAHGIRVALLLQVAFMRWLSICGGISRRQEAVSPLFWKDTNKHVEWSRL
jgi:hypothetical protein